jgi:hypothetical protein
VIEDKGDTHFYICETPLILKNEVKK